MSITLKDAVDFLLSEGYIFKYGERFKFASKTYLELTAKDLPGHTHSKPAAINWVTAFTQFIMAAKIPSRAEDSRGGYYSLNQYSEPAMKAFRKIVEGGVSLEDLVASTTLYYKSGVKLKVKIGRYIEEGLWRGDYEAYMASKEAGNLREHEKQQKSDGTTTSWSVG